ncbi:MULTISPECIES: site-specific DNA-methyltransferase [Achromobacter]|uniref:site-specific DNA-methyltransferase n=1 Tax=Achromobacter TaxID=222 RepID=UPI0025C531A6|nr:MULTISPECIES: site-specific DNA-methyltransferase [Achromobacter]
MEKITAASPEAQSADLVAGNIEQLKALFPELITEGANGVAVNVDVLKALVGDASVTDADEKYGLNWHGKRRARQLALTPSTGTLRPCPEDSVDWESTRNLMIEGDNLEVLKLLQKSYAGKVKLIYIDPPYNTGKDFVYPDNFQDNIKNYLELTGQVEGGQKISSNTEASGRFHTDWLNMIYPRLILARDLLKKDGIVFISIDDSEVQALKIICNDIFGEENFFAQIPWQSRTSVQNDTDLSVQHEYLVAYARNRRHTERRLKESNADRWFDMDSFAAYPLPLDVSRYDNPDNDSRGKWKADPFDAPNIRENLTYAIKNPVTGEEFWPPRGRCWRMEERRFLELLADNRIVFGRTGESRPQLKVFYEEKKDLGEVSTSWFDGPTYGTATLGTQELQRLFEGESPFSFPKPTKLLAAITRLASRGSDIVCDFFSGSGSTGHAVMAQNAADGGNRRCVLVQLPEPLDRGNKDQKVAAELCDQLGKPRNIAELTKERLRRAGAKVKADNPDWQGDTGFRVFKLGTSNIRAWNPKPDDLEATLFDHQDHLLEGRSEADVLYELLLKLGLDLCVPIERRSIEGLDVHAVGGGVLLACLAEKITREQVESLAQGIIAWHKELAPAGDTTCVFRDSAFADDVAKTNLAAILEQHGIQNVRSL